MCGAPRLRQAGGRAPRCRRSTGNASLAALPTLQHADGGEQRAAWPTTFQRCLLPSPQPSGVCALPRTPRLLSGEPRITLRLTKGHTHNTPSVVRLKGGATACHSVLSLHFVFTLLFKCQGNEVHLGANKSFRQNGCYSNCAATN